MTTTPSETGNPFFDQPILNSPYGYPGRHWELDPSGQPTQQIIESRRRAEFITPIPKPRKRKGISEQQQLNLGNDEGLSDGEQLYDHTAVINSVRQEVDRWRQLPNSAQWGVTPETARLLQHWRHHQFSDIRPFFCQVEAVETAIWLTEVAPRAGKLGKTFIDHLDNANHGANPELSRLALKLATGAGKTTVMAMLIAWQTINAVRHSNSKRFTRGFLIVAPGLTIRDRLRVLLPNDPDSYYQSRELVPPDLMPALERAKIVITNYHAFKRRERIALSKGGRSLLQGRGEALDTLETEGQMLQRVMPELMGIKNILVLNDEAHHCYREKPGVEAGESDEPVLKGDDRKEAQKNSEAARLWISGLEATKRKLGVTRVIDLSATPFFLRGSGYAEGTLFPWTLSDFSLMDAIECGIVKLPRVPVADNIPGQAMPMFRNLWEHIRARMPKKGRGKAKTHGQLDPLDLPVELQTALSALYGHYEKTYELWQGAGVKAPPCFIVVCNNTSTSKLVYDYISGFARENEDGSSNVVNGRLDLFRNYDEHGNQYARPRTLLIDSEQLESGEALDKKFHAIAADEIDRFRREIIERTGDRSQADNLTDQDLLREVMNTVGKPGRLGGSIRCVVTDYLLWFGKERKSTKYRQAYYIKKIGGMGGGEYKKYRTVSGKMTNLGKTDPNSLPEGARIFRNDNLISQGYRQFTMTPRPGQYVCAAGEVASDQWLVTSEKSSERGEHQPLPTTKRAAIFIGPEFGTVTRPDLVEATREAADAGFDALIACAFNYDAHASEFNQLGRIPVLKARMNADLHMADDLKNTGKGNLFVIFGEPDVEVTCDLWLVASSGRLIASYEYIRELSGLGSLEEINRLGREDLSRFKALSTRGKIRANQSTAQGSGVGAGKYRGRSGEDGDKGISAVPQHSRRLTGGSRDPVTAGVPTENAGPAILPGVNAFSGRTGPNGHRGDEGVSGVTTVFVGSDSS